jgi:hypothetical protein
MAFRAQRQLTITCNATGSTSVVIRLKPIDNAWWVRPFVYSIFKTGSLGGSLPIKAGLQGSPLHPDPDAVRLLFNPLTFTP